MLDEWHSQMVRKASYMPNVMHVDKTFTHYLSSVGSRSAEANTFLYFVSTRQICHECCLFHCLRDHRHYACWLIFSFYLPTIKVEQVWVAAGKAVEHLTCALISTWMCVNTQGYFYCVFQLNYANATMVKSVRETMKTIMRHIQ